MQGKPWVCPDCGASADEPGACKACGEGPLLDAGDPSVQAVFRQRAQDAADRRRARLTWVAVPIGMVLGGWLGAGVPQMLPIPFGRPIQILAMMTIVAYGALRLLLAVWAPRDRVPDSQVDPSVRRATDAMRRMELRRPAIILSILSLVGLAIGGFAWWRSHAAAQRELERRAAAAQAWADLQQCLLGARIGEGAPVEEQARLVELAGARDGGWPERCNEHVTALYGQLDAKDFGPALREELVQRFGCDKACVNKQPDKQLLGLDEIAAAVPLGMVGSTVAAPPRIEADLLSKGDFGSLSAGDAVVKSRDRLEDGTVRLLLSSRTRGLTLCEARPTDGLDCRALELPLSPATMAIVPGSEPAAISGSERALDARRFYDAASGDAVKLSAGRQSGFALVRNDEGAALVFVENGEASKTKKIELPEGSDGPFLVAGHLGWVAGDGGKRALFVRRLGDDGALGKKQQVGLVGGYAGAPRVCRHGPSAALLFGDDASSYAMAFFDGSSWSDTQMASMEPAVIGEEPGAPPPRPAPPPRAPEPEPSDEPPAAAASDDLPPSARADDPDPHIAKRAAMRDAAEFGMIGLLNSGAGGDPDAPTAPWGRDDASAKAGASLFGEDAGNYGLLGQKLPSAPFVCSDEAGVVTWRSPARAGAEAIHEVRCTAKGCVHRLAYVRGIQASEWWIATALGERTLLVWRRSQGDLRMRFAELPDLDGTADVLVMDGQEHGGPATVDLEALVDVDAVLFLFRGLGWHGLRFGPGGDYAPLE
jgi:hypothetical protein